MSDSRPSLRRFSATPSVAEATPPAGHPASEREQLLDVLHRLDAVMARIDGAIDSLQRLDSERTHRQAQLG